MLDVNRYQAEMARTRKEHKPLSKKEVALLDWTCGLAGETGEACDLIKHKIFHGEENDTTFELCKELGDILWYISAIADEIGVPMEVLFKLNAFKLNQRYKNGYSDEASANRHKIEAKKALKDYFNWLTAKEDAGE